MLTFLTGCAIQDCKFKPHVEIQEPTQNNDLNSPTSMLKDIQDNARPSGEMVCTY